MCFKGADPRLASVASLGVWCCVWLCHAGFGRYISKYPSKKAHQLVGWVYLIYFIGLC